MAAAAPAPRLPSATRCAAQLPALVARALSLPTLLPGLSASEQRALVPALRAFYRARAHAPVWADAERTGPQALQLMEYLPQVDGHGLAPARYRVEAVSFHARRGRPVALCREWAAWEVRLTAAFFALVADLHGGRPSARPADSQLRRPPVDPGGVLARGLASGDLAAELEALAPAHAGYRALREALGRYRAVAARGGWPSLPDGPELSEGVQDTRVGLLRERLGAEGDAPRRGDALTYDGALAEAVQRFQVRHGLTPSGVVDAATLRALQVPVEARLRQLELNLERWRWVPDVLGRRFVIINVPGYELVALEEGQPTLSLRAAVGTPDWPTPLLVDSFRSIQVHPEWVIPPGIAAREVLPTLQSEPGSAQRLRVEVFEVGSGRRVDATRVDWSRVQAEPLPYVFRQAPGPDNPLGPIKFPLANAFQVLVHGTPDVGPFSEAALALTHGCIRLESPARLAEVLLGPDGDSEALHQALERGEPLELTLPEPIPVYFLYWTAWVDAAGRVQFRDDLYGHDAQLTAQLGH